MNDLLTDGKAVAISLLGVVVGLLSYFGREALKRIDRLEQHSVTKEALKEFHQENLGNFDELKQLIRDNNQDAIKSRHDLRDKIGVVVGQVSKVEGRLDEIAKRLP